MEEELQEPMPPRELTPELLAAAFKWQQELDEQSLRIKFRNRMILLVALGAGIAGGIWFSHSWVMGIVGGLTLLLMVFMGFITTLQHVKGMAAYALAQQAALEPGKGHLFLSGFADEVINPGTARIWFSNGGALSIDTMRRLDMELIDFLQRIKAQFNPEFRILEKGIR